MLVAKVYRQMRSSLTSLVERSLAWLKRANRREHGDQPEHVSAGEEIFAEIVAYLLGQREWRGVENCIEHGLLGVESLVGLGKIADV